MGPISAAEIAWIGVAGTLGFDDLPQSVALDHAVASGYAAQRLISWGDPIIAGAPAFDPKVISPSAQKGQYGFNNAFVAFLPLPKASAVSDRGLLWVNFQHASIEAMLPRRLQIARGAEHTALEMAALGGGIVEISRVNGTWSVIPESAYARRITAESDIDISGPAAGHPRLTTSEDASGRLVKGMLSNSSGGVTPWNTILTCEQDFNRYFMGVLPKGSREALSHGRFFIRAAGGGALWGRDVPRFDRGKEPNEANRFGWVVEVDPYDPRSRPVKRTALGRFKHKAATTALAPDGRVVVYMGDAQTNECIYKYVSKRAYDPSQPGLEQELLDHGTLYAAKFDDVTVEWRPLRHGEGPLTAANGFESQADVLIDARQAAELLGATRMDRPGEVEANPMTGRVYVMLNGNPGRRTTQIDKANPRNWNQYGHILEMVPPSGPEGKPDHAATVFTWNVLLLAGFEAEKMGGQERPLWSARYGPGTKVVMMNPDTCACDHKGRLWIATDSAREVTQRPDGLYACGLEGAARAVVKLFYTAPSGAAVCGPAFTPDGETLPRHSASGRRQNSLGRTSMAGFREGDAGASLAGGDHQVRWRPDRRVAARQKENRGAFDRPPVRTNENYYSESRPCPEL